MTLRWVDGYEKRFGLYYVDYRDENRPRYAKKSSIWYTDYISSHRDSYEGVIRVISPIHRPIHPPIAIATCDLNGDGACSWYEYLQGAFIDAVQTTLALTIENRFVP
jgi:hypothetical protein